MESEYINAMMRIGNMIIDEIMNKDITIDNVLNRLAIEDISTDYNKTEYNKIESINPFYHNQYAEFKSWKKLFHEGWKK